MTLKNLAIATAAALSFAAVPMALADNTQPPLVDLIPVGCSVSDGGARLAEWAWTDGGAQTQFGGGAVYTVDYEIPEQASSGTMEVEVELVRYEEDTDLAEKMVYSCPGMGSQEKERAEEGSCMAAIMDVEAAVQAATQAKLNQLGSLGPDDIPVVESHELEGVFVKAMNPGVVRGGGGRQNYQKIDVCEVEANEIEENGE